MKLDERIVEVKRLIADGERHKDEDVGHKIALKSLKTHLTELLNIGKDDKPPEKRERMAFSTTRRK
jgi:hypothetical protein